MGGSTAWSLPSWPSGLRAWALKSRVITGPTDALVEALYKRELDVLVMGLTDKTPHSGKLALSQPYLEVKTHIGVAPGQMPLADWAGQRIAVDPERLELVAQIRNWRPNPCLLKKAKPGADHGRIRLRA